MVSAKSLIFFNNQELGAPTVTGTWTSVDISSDGHRLRHFRNSVLRMTRVFIGLDQFSVSSGGLSVGRDVPRALDLDNDADRFDRNGAARSKCATLCYDELSKFDGSRWRGS